MFYVVHSFSIELFLKASKQIVKCVCFSLPHMCIHAWSPIPDESYPAALCLTCTVSLSIENNYQSHWISSN